MKVLYILNATAAKGGATKSFLALADAMTSDGNEVAVVVPEENGITPILMDRGWRVLSIPYYYCALPSLSWNVRDIVAFVPKLLWYILVNHRAKIAVTEFAKEWNPDIVHDNTSVTHLGHHVAKALDIPHIIHIREYGWQDFRIAIIGLKKRLRWRKSYSIAITERLAKFRDKGLPKGRMSTIYNGIVKEIPSDYISDKEPYFLYAGRIIETKGAGDLIDAYILYAKEELQHHKSPLRLKLAGEEGTDGYSWRLRGKLKDSMLGDYVDWIGDVPDIDSYYKKAAATVIPSFHEGFGRVMPEAIAQGCLCIVRNSDGLAEQLENGRNLIGKEIALSFDNPEGLLANLKAVGNNFQKGDAFYEGGIYKKIIDAGREVVGRLYTTGAYARNVMNLYSRVLGSCKI